MKAVKRAQGGAVTPGSLKTRLGLVFLAATFLWAAVPGRSPSRLEEFLLAPFAFLAGLPAYLRPVPAVDALPPPRATTVGAWRRLRRLEEDVTSLEGEHRALFADVLARRGRGGGGLQDKLLLACSPGEALVRERVPCLVKDVLIGFLDRVRPPRPSRLDRLLIGLGLQERVELPDLAWVRLLHSRRIPWVEPLRLPVTVIEGERRYSAILAPAKEEFRFPLRLCHPASLERPLPGAKVYTEGNTSPLAVGPGRFIGRVRRDPAYPELDFIEPEYRPGAIHCVHLFRPGVKREERALPGPLERGRLVPALLSPLPVGGLGGGGLLLMAGSTRGVRRGGAVVRGWTLAGKVDSVGLFHCRALRPGEPGFRLQVVVTGTGEGRLTRGVITAAADGTGRSTWRGATSRSPGPRVGDLVWTAPEILDMPKGLFVGRVATGPDGAGRFVLERPRPDSAPWRLGIFRFGRGKGAGE